MDGIATTQQNALTPLHVLAQEARIYSESFVLNTINLGRVLTEAKKQVKHGEWADWVRENTGGMSVRNAQQFMQAYARFGDKEAFAGIDKSKMYKMLSLPAGTEDAFIEQNDVAHMTSREVEEAVRKVREKMNAQIAQERNDHKASKDQIIREMNAQIAEERKARKQAEERAEELELQKDNVPDGIRDSMVRQLNKIDELNKAISLAEREKRLLNQEITGLKKETLGLRRDLEERDEMLEEAQQEHERVRAELLNMQSAAAKGDAERVPADEFTVDVFASAVRQFVGACARMPHMRNTFSMMMLSEKNAYEELLCTIEAWARDARSALDTVDLEVQVHG